MIQVSLLKLNTWIIRYVGLAFEKIILSQKEVDIATIIAGCIINDRKAQERLYARFYVAMAALCVRYIPDRQDAMLVLNDGFLKVFKNIQKYDASKAGIYAWIKTIMINTCIDFIRRRPLSFTLELNGSLDEPAIENAVIGKLDAEEWLSLIKRLPQATQLVFNLNTVDGYNHREIAGILGISEGTSRWHLSEARKQLREAAELLRKKHERTI